MAITPFLTFQGHCREALELYERALKTQVQMVMLFSDMTDDPEGLVTEENKHHILLATIQVGDTLLRLADTFDPLNEDESQRVGLSLELEDEEDIRHAFEVLAEDGVVLKELQKTYFSDVYGELIDVNGVYWYFGVYSND